MALTSDEDPGTCGPQLDDPGSFNESRRIYGAEDDVGALLQAEADGNDEIFVGLSEVTNDCGDCPICPAGLCCDGNISDTIYLSIGIGIGSGGCFNDSSPFALTGHVSWGYWYGTIVTCDHTFHVMVECAGERFKLTWWSEDCSSVWCGYAINPGGFNPDLCNQYPAGITFHQPTAADLFGSCCPDLGIDCDDNAIDLVISLNQSPPASDPPPADPGKPVPNPSPSGCWDGETPPSSQSEPWWITKELGVLQQLEPPVDWLGGPHPTQPIAEWWRDQIPPPSWCVEWWDHAGQASNPPVIDPDDYSTLPRTFGDSYVECLTQTEIDDLIAGSTEVVISGLGDLRDGTYYYNCPKDTTHSDATNKLRRFKIVDGPWYTEQTEYPTVDNWDLDGDGEIDPGHEGQDPEGQEPDPELGTEGYPPRFEIVPDSDPLPWHGFSQLSGTEKCKQNCPPCHRLAYCTIVDPLSGLPILVPEIPDAGTDWRQDLPAQEHPELSEAMHWNEAFCSWICGNPCNRFVFPIYCDGSHVSYIGCADRPRSPLISIDLPEEYRVPSPDLSKTAGKIRVRANSKIPLQLSLDADKRAEELTPCVYRGDKTGEYKQCPTCNDTILMPVYKCEKFGKCTIASVPGMKGCVSCKERTTKDKKIVGAVKIPLNLCEHLDSAQPPPTKDSDPRLNWRKCDKGHGLNGIVCPCKTFPEGCKGCPDFVSENAEDE